MAAVQDILNIYSLTSGGETETRIDAYAREVYLSDAPLMLMMPSAPAKAAEWTVTGETVRPQTATLNAAILAGGTTLTVTDATPFQVGDVLEMFATGGASTDRMLVTAVASSTTLTVQRGFEGTTAVANDNTGNKTIYLVGTASTGSEINKTTFRNAASTYSQRLQTFMYRVAVGGLTQAMPNVILPNGMPDLLTQAERTKMIEFLKDCQTAQYYGLGQTRGATTDRPTMLGLKGIITTYNSASNVTTSAASGFTQQNLMTDLIQKCITGGGNPDLLVFSPDWATGLNLWGATKQYITEQGSTANLGIPVTRVYYPFGGRILEILFDYNLRPGTALCLTKSDLKTVEGRPIFYKPAGSRGDAMEGDFIGDYSVEVGHPGFHAWRQGVTGFA